MHNCIVVVVMRKLVTVGMIDKDTVVLDDDCGIGIDHQSCDEETWGYTKTWEC